MMWETLEQEPYREPLELRMLKRNLANLYCCCKTCQKSRLASTVYRTNEVQNNEEIEEEEYSDQQNEETEENEEKRNDEIHDEKYEEQNMGTEEDDVQKNEEVQVEEYSNDSLDRFSKRQQTLMEFGFCPTCYLSLNILRGGGLTKILKDEQTEAMTKSPSCHKSTSKTVVFLEKTTSLTNKPVLKYSNLTFNDNTSELTSDTSVHQRQLKTPSSREVTFTMDYINELESSIIPSPPRPPSPPKYSSSCVCVNTENEMLQVSPISPSSPRSPPSPPGHLRYPPNCNCSHIHEFINAIKPPPPWDVI